MDDDQIARFVPPPLKSDVVFAERTFRRRRYFVAKNKLSEKYFRLSAEEAKIALWFDGKSSLADLSERCGRAFPQYGSSPQEIFGFYRRLSSASLLNDAPEQFVRQRQAADRMKSSLFGLWSRGIGSLIFFKVPLFNPNSWIGVFAPIWRALFTPWALVVFIGLWAYALTGMVLHFADGSESGLSFLEGFSFPLIWIGLAFSKTLHEIGHAATCKAFGGNVNEMGLSLICLAPCGYVDASDAWMMDSRWKRLAVSVAGVYTELIIGGVAAVVWLHTADGLLHSFSLGLMLIASVNTLLFNLNPLMRFDGYYLASDLLDIPNLRPKALGWVGGHLKRLFFGTPPPPRHDGSGLVFSLYAFAAFAYIVVISFSIGFVFLRFLQPIGLQSIGVALGVAVFVSLIGLPIVKAIREVTLPQATLGAAKPLPRALILLLLIAAVLLLIALVPSHHIVRGQGISEGSAVFSARVSDGGVVEEVFVGEGEEVRAGELLFRCSDEDLYFSRQRIEAAIEREKTLFRLKVGDVRSDRNRAAAVHGENISRLQNELARIDARIDNLEVRSPIDGTVVGTGEFPLDRIEGRAFPRGAFVLRVSSEKAGRVVVALAERDARIVEVGNEAVGRSVADALPVSLRVSAMGSSLASPSEIRGGHRLVDGGVVPLTDNRLAASVLDRFPVVVAELVPEGASADVFGELLPGQRVKVRIEGAPTTMGGRLWRKIRLFWKDRIG